MRDCKAEYTKIVDHNVASTQQRTLSAPKLVLILIGAVCGIILTHDLILHSRPVEETVSESPVGGLKRQMIYFNEEKNMKRFNQAVPAIEASRESGKWAQKPTAVLFTDLISTLQKYQIDPTIDEMIIFGGIEYINDLATKEQFADLGGREALYDGIRKLLTSLKPGARLVVQICNADSIQLIRTLSKTPGVADGVTLEHPTDWSFVCPAGIFDYDGPLQPAQIMSKFQKEKKVNEIVPLGAAYTFTGDESSKQQFEKLCVDMKITAFPPNKCSIQLKKRGIVSFEPPSPKNNIVPLEQDKENVAPTGGDQSASSSSGSPRQTKS